MFKKGQANSKARRDMNERLAHVQAARKRALAEGIERLSVASSTGIEPDEEIDPRGWHFYKAEFSDGATLFMAHERRLTNIDPNKGGWTDYVHNPKKSEEEYIEDVFSPDDWGFAQGLSPVDIMSDQEVAQIVDILGLPQEAWEQYVDSNPDKNLPEAPGLTDYPDLDFDE